jgi:FkbM family methyltransferase
MKKLLILNFNISRTGAMNDHGKKNFFSRLLRIGVVFRYVGESAGIVMQGYSLSDKLILFSYFLKIPAIVVKSLATGKSFRELEEKNKRLRGNVTISNRFGRFYCGNNILTVYTVNKNNEKNLYHHVDLINGIFIDVGAHAGKYSIPAANNPEVTVVALEPDPFNFGLLRKNVELNKLPNIICLNKGAFSSAGKIPFYTTGRGEGMHSIYRQPGSQQEEMIEVDTLDNILDQLKIGKHVSLIKIDVEGAEWEVLQGAERILAKDQPDLLIEIWRDDHSRFEKIKAYLQRFGYERAQREDGDNVFFTKWVHSNF